MSSSEVIVTVKFRERGATGPVFHVLVAQKGEVPKKDATVEALVALSKKAASGTRRIFWSTAGVDAEVSELQQERGISEIVSFNCFGFYSDGRSATYIERRPPIGQSSSAS